MSQVLRLGGLGRRGGVDSSDCDLPPCVQIDEIDYDSRLAAYRRLTPEAWSDVLACGGTPILLQRCFQDLRNADDLALRHAAAQALSR